MSQICAQPERSDKDLPRAVKTVYRNKINTHGTTNTIDGVPATANPHGIVIEKDKKGYRNK